LCLSLGEQEGAMGLVGIAVIEGGNGGGIMPLPEEEQALVVFRAPGRRDRRWSVRWFA
jgi:hypothetical protein